VELREFVINRCTKADVVIAGAGKAAALPGIIKAHLCSVGSEVPVIGVGFWSDEDLDGYDAARLSIEKLPGNPVELDHNGQAYMEEEGFTFACWAAIYNEFLPKMMKIKDPSIDHPCFVM
jgi:phosphoribosylcarboxyaminoimidazole (NCAIR) mutase